MQQFIKNLILIDISRQPQMPKPTEDDIVDAKIMYYYPPNADQFTIRQQVGLAEGCIMFHKDFAEEELEIISTDQFSQLFLKCYENMYMIMAVQNTSHKSNELVLKLFEVLVLFHGPLNTKSKEVISQIMERFITAWQLEFSDSPDQLDGFYYCPVDSRIFLKCCTYLQKVQYTNKVLGALFSDGLLISTSIPLDCLRILYRLLFLDRKGKLSPIWKNSSEPKMILKDYLNPNINLVTGGGFLFQVFPIIFWNDIQYQVQVVFRGQISILYLTQQQDFLLQIPQFFDEIPKQIQTPQQEGYRYVYFNKINFAIKREIAERHEKFDI